MFICDASHVNPPKVQLLAWFFFCFCSVIFPPKRRGEGGGDCAISSAAAAVTDRNESQIDFNTSKVMILAVRPTLASCNDRFLWFETRAQPLNETRIDTSFLLFLAVNFFFRFTSLALRVIVCVCVCLLESGIRHDEVGFSEGGGCLFDLPPKYPSGTPRPNPLWVLHVESTLPTPNEL